jgi:hypothetical protein
MGGGDRAGRGWPYWRMNPRRSTRTHELAVLADFAGAHRGVDREFVGFEAPDMNRPHSGNTLAVLFDLPYLAEY